MDNKPQSSHHLPVRYYLQSMFNSLGYDWMYLTTLRDRRQVFQMERTFENITKYRSLKDIGHLDTLLSLCSTT